MTGRFQFGDMTIQVEEYRGELTGDMSYWLRRVDSGPEVTVGVKRSLHGMAVSNCVRVDPRELDRALSEFLKARDR